MKEFTLFIALLISPLIALDLYAAPRDNVMLSAWEKGDKTGWESETSRWDSDNQKHEMKQKKQKERPAGWDKGGKEGWRSSVPPGQEGKYKRDPRTNGWKPVKDRLPWLE